MVKLNTEQTSIMTTSSSISYGLRDKISGELFRIKPVKGTNGYELTQIPDFPVYETKSYEDALVTSLSHDLTDLSSLTKPVNLKFKPVDIEVVQLQKEVTIQSLEGHKSSLTIFTDEDILKTFRLSRHELQNWFFELDFKDDEKYLEKDHTCVLVRAEERLRPYPSSNHFHIAKVVKNKAFLKSGMSLVRIYGIGEVGSAMAEKHPFFAEDPQDRYYVLFINR